MKILASNLQKESSFTDPQAQAKLYWPKPSPTKLVPPFFASLDRNSFKNISVTVPSWCVNFSKLLVNEKEIQRTMLELLTQLDGFDARGEIKVIMATNRIESLDPALLRPGRIDRKVEFPAPDIKTKRRIFGIHTSKMTLADDVKVEELITAKDNISGADIKAICTEAGLLALRERRRYVTAKDFDKAKETALFKKKETVGEGMFL